jgi:hypothetical protein
MSRVSPALAPTSISASGGGSWARAGSSVAHLAGSLVCVRLVSMTSESSAWLPRTSARSVPISAGVPSR